MAKSALIWGASGVSGWAFVNEVLNDYPSNGTWTKVHAMTNRPLKQENSLWPKDPRLNIVSGIDLLSGTQGELEAEIKSKVVDIVEVTHVYYLAYKASLDVQQEFNDAKEMFRRSTIAIDNLSHSLEFVVIQTGAKIYGCHFLQNRPKDIMILPLRESLPRLQTPPEYPLFYHAQTDWITEYAKEKRWGWCETRPDFIIGFVPNQNAYSLATVIGIFLSLYVAMAGKGATCSFPGSQGAWIAKSNDSSSDMIARQTLHLSLGAGTERGGAYNVADSRLPSTWSVKWPILCEYFGLKSAPPPDDIGSVDIRNYIKSHYHVWERLEIEHELRTGIADSPLSLPGFEHFLLSLFDFDRDFDMTKMYSTGFAAEMTTRESWLSVFGKMKAAKLIP